MKLLIAVKSCMRDRDRGCHQVIRDTWAKDVKSADVMFFVGKTGLNVHLEDDEDTLSVRDDYYALPFKTREILQWSAQHGYDFTFLCDNDTFVVLNRLLNCGFESYDYSGKFCRAPGTTFNYSDREGKYLSIHPWASGGFGYFVSRRAAGFVTVAQPNVWAEDMFVGQVLGSPIQRGEISAYDIPNFAGNITWHYPNHFRLAPYDVIRGWMPDMQRLVTS